MAGQLSLLYLKSFGFFVWLLPKPANVVQWVQYISCLLVLLWFTGPLILKLRQCVIVAGSWSCKRKGAPCKRS
jgi:hypothetical protein